MDYKETKLETILTELKTKLQNLYGKKLKTVLLYGSWAREEAVEESDIDLMVVLKGDIKQGREIDRMLDIIFETSLKYNVLISVHPVCEKDFSRTQSPLLLNVRREGIKI